MWVGGCQLCSHSIFLYSNQEHSQSDESGAHDVPVLEESPSYYRLFGPPELPVQEHGEEDWTNDEHGDHVGWEVDHIVREKKMWANAGDTCESLTGSELVGSCAGKCDRHEQTRPTTSEQQKLNPRQHSQSAFQAIRFKDAKLHSASLTPTTSNSSAKSLAFLTMPGLLPDHSTSSSGFAIRPIFIALRCAQDRVMMSGDKATGTRIALWRREKKGKKKKKSD
jgi:hypothetical protein